MKSTNPLISIITVVYNGEKFLEKTIQSVINQSYKNIEYIIIDGGSRDKTVDIIKKYEDKIDYWVSEKDDGIYDAMNKGIKVARGEFIAFLNADDWYEKDSVQYVVDAYNKNKDVDFFYGDLNFLKENKEAILWKGNKGFKGLEIPHPTCFIRGVVLKQNLFDTNFKIAADADLILKLFGMRIKSFYINRVIVNFRDGGASSQFLLTQKENFQILYKYIGLSYAIKSFLKRGFVVLKNLIIRAKY